MLAVVFPQSIRCRTLTQIWVYPSQKYKSFELNASQRSCQVSAFCDSNKKSKSCNFERFYLLAIGASFPTELSVVSTRTCILNFSFLPLAVQPDISVFFAFEQNSVTTRWLISLNIRQDKFQMHTNLHVKLRLSAVSSPGVEQITKICLLNLLTYILTILKAPLV